MSLSLLKALLELNLAAARSAARKYILSNVTYGRDPSLLPQSLLDSFEQAHPITTALSTTADILAKLDALESFAALSQRNRVLCVI
jgi:hypothetical protein